MPNDQRPASTLARIFLQEDLNFLVTNRIPRKLATQLVGWFSTIESRTLTRLSIEAWQLFAGDLRLYEAKKKRFRSVRECFTRELREGARPVDPDPSVLVSPCDAIVGAHGSLVGTELLQAKGLGYTLEDLLVDPALAARHRDGQYVTLRLKSSMYHRFHAPCDGRATRVTYVSGDTWNVNPIALKRVEKLFCKNERAVIELDTGSPDETLTMVPVASILVASLKIHAVEQMLDLRHQGRTAMACDAAFEKGQELGYFQSGSTIILLANGPLVLDPQVREGELVRVGTPLFRRIPGNRSPMRPS
ncbi:MAG: archaetidylserine decarboxylase [Polyangiaceae bacterium]